HAHAASLALHAPAAHRSHLDAAEDEVLDDEPDDDHRQQSGEDAGDLELVLVLVDVPAEAARSRRDPEYELGGDQRPPGKRPADLEPGEDARKRRRDE